MKRQKKYLTLREWKSQKRKKIKKARLKRLRRDGFLKSNPSKKVSALKWLIVLFGSVAAVSAFAKGQK
jgi:hypothetical protein